MSNLDLMLRLPEVAYLVDRIPIARYAIKANPIHLRFLQHARDSRMRLRDQCEAFKVPWHARKISAAVATRELLLASRLLPASVFTQSFPNDPDAVDGWSACLLAARPYALPASALAWFAHNALSIDSNDSARTLRYLAQCKGLQVSTPAEEVKRRAAKLAERNLPMVSLIERVIAGTRPFRFEDGVMIGLDLGTEAVMPRRPETLRMVADHIVYAPALTKPFTHSGIDVRLLTRRDEFDQLGMEMNNCVRGSDRPHFLTIRPQRNYFDSAFHHELNIASVRREGAAVAAVEYGPDWSIRSIKGPRNRDVVDVSVLSAAVAFGQMAKAS